MKPPLSHALQILSCFLALASAPAAQVDPSFQPAIPGGTVHAIAVADPGIFIGGHFSSVNGQPISSLARLAPDGSLDPSFPAQELDGPVFSIAVAEDGTIIAGGSFSETIASWNPNGTAHPGFLLSQGRVCSVALSRSGQVLVGGTFWSDPGVFVGRLERDGTVDASFSCSLELPFSMEAGVHALAVQPDGRIIAGGNFQIGSNFATLVRLNPDGSIDSSFNSPQGPTLYPRRVAILGNGRILVAGVADSSGRGFLRRLNPDGSPDHTFAEISADDAIESFDVDPLGRIVLGGAFQQIHGTARERLARLHPDGALDLDWTIGADQVVKAIVCQNDHVLVGGAFTEIGGVPRSGLARILAGGNDFRFHALSLSSTGDMHLSLKGEPGLSYIVESSTDLSTWSVFKTNVATVEGIRIPTSSPTAPRQFFRARQLEPLPES